MKHPKPYILNVLASIEAVKAYRPASEIALKEDAKTQDAILMRLQDIGENLAKLRDAFPEYWRENAVEAWYH